MAANSPEQRTVTRGEESSLADHELVRETLAGRTEAFRVLVERYSGMVYNVAYGMLHHAEETRDAVQEIFYRVFRGLAGFRPEYPFGVWVRRIAVNYLLDLRKKKRLPVVAIDDSSHGEAPVFQVADDGRSVLEDLLQREQEQLVRQAVEKLPPKYGMVIVLRHFEEMTYEEIAETLGCPLGTVMTRLHRARQKLADLLIPSLERDDDPIVQT